MPDFPCIPDPLGEHPPGGELPETAPPNSPAATPPASPAGPSLRSAAGLLALQTLPGIGEQTALRIALLSERLDPYFEGHRRSLTTALDDAAREIDACRQAGIEVVSIFDDAYPGRLRTIENPSPVLYIKGAAALLSRERTYALAGTPDPDWAGIARTERIAAELAAAGWHLVSGLAKGVQTIAHRAANSAGAATVAVLPCGFGAISRHAEKPAEAILEHGGALLSPFRPDFRSGRFPALAAGRLIVALGRALILAQVSLTDGAINTTRDAAALGRPVFCPHPLLGAKADQGLALLLETPANTLAEKLPAWKSAGRLKDRVGPQPLASALDPDDPVPALERALAAEAQHLPRPRWWPEPRPSASPAE